LSGKGHLVVLFHTLIMAIWRRGKPDSLLHHSDQGSQYTSAQFQRLMADHGKRLAEAVMPGNSRA
jgi:transposase InsO family protein